MKRNSKEKQYITPAEKLGSIAIGLVTFIRVALMIASTATVKEE